MLAKKLKQSNNFISILFFSILLMALLDLASCSEKDQDSPPISSVEQKENSKTGDAKDLKKQVKDQKKVEVKEVYTYNSNGKADPFVPMVSDSTVNDSTQPKTASKKTVTEVPMTPLQKLDVDDFTLVAVIATPNGFCALLEDPAMNGYKVKEGMQIGRKSGVIKKILYNSVIIEENKEIESDKIKKKK